MDGDILVGRAAQMGTLVKNTEAMQRAEAFQEQARPVWFESPGRIKSLVSQRSRLAVCILA